jgi:hypothetical protein
MAEVPKRVCGIGSKQERRNNMEFANFPGGFIPDFRTFSSGVDFINCFLRSKIG